MARIRHTHPFGLDELPTGRSNGRIWIRPKMAGSKSCRPFIFFYYCGHELDFFLRRDGRFLRTKAVRESSGTEENAICRFVRKTKSAVGWVRQENMERKNWRSLRKFICKCDHPVKSYLRRFEGIKETLNSQDHNFGKRIQSKVVKAYIKVTKLTISMGDTDQEDKVRKATAIDSLQD